MIKRLFLLISIVMIVAGYFTLNTPFAILGQTIYIGSLLVLFGVLILISIFIYTMGNGCWPSMR
jgi:hypothetical protein